MPAGRGEQPEAGDDTVQGVQLPPSHVRVGDTVVYTSKFNATYRFTVRDVDDAWITFETGQKVHADRFEREAFAVVRETGTEVGSTESDSVTANEPSRVPDRIDRTDRDDRAGEESSGDELSPTAAE